LLPLLIGYVAYRIIAYLLALGHDGSASFFFWESYRALPRLQTLFAEIAGTRPCSSLCSSSPS
jgi:hypothetical protein